MENRILLSIFLIVLCLPATAQVDTVYKIPADTVGKIIPDTSGVNLIQPIPNINIAEKKDDNESQVYHLRPAVDVPIIVAGAGWSFYCFSKIYSKTPPTAQQVQSLKKEDLNIFDRWAVVPYSKRAANLGDGLFYSAMPLPFLFFLTGERMRKDYGKLSVLYLETMAVTGIIHTTTTTYVDRYRPYTYSPESPAKNRQNKVATNSFFAGHVVLVSTSVFFVAKVYSDYYPESHFKWAVYGGAAVATAGVAYARHIGGHHFPTDIALGITVGTLSGILIPQFHKTSNKNHSVGLLPFTDGEVHGLSFTYKWK